MSDHVDSHVLPPCSFLRATHSERKGMQINVSKEK